MLDNNAIVAEWYDIYETRHLPFWKHLYFVWGVYAFVLGVLCIGIIIVLHRYTSNSKPLSPRTKALLALSKIRTQHLYIKNMRIFYIELTQIAKQYISEEFRLDVTAKTDAELLAMVKSETTTIAGMSSLQPLFMHVERIKFEAQRVEPEKMRQDADLLNCFIELHHARKKNKQTK